MNYTGKLYGKIRRYVIPLKLTSEDVDRMEQELAELKAWKDSAMKVMPDFQAIGNALGLTLGVDVSPEILPEIIRLKAIEFAAIALKKAKGRYHTEQAANHLLSLLP